MGVQTVEVPFVTVGNKQALTDTQIMNESWLGEFIARFPHCFERSEMMQCYYYYSEGVPTSGR